MFIDNSPAITEYDLHLFAEGKHSRIYDKLGAHVDTVNGKKGVRFSVWAPAAVRVGVAGNFNNWAAGANPMVPLGSSGVWEAFVSEAAPWDMYKYEIVTPEQKVILKSDPYASFSELRPDTASIVYDLSGYEWNDHSWLENRSKASSLEAPISIYEVHFGSWASSSAEGHVRLGYRELADKLLPYVKEMGYTHIEILPLSEHPFDGSWGYQVTGYYSVTSRFGEPRDFMYFVDRCHQEGIGVFLDWVPAHFAKDAHGLGKFDGTPLYEHEDPRRGEHPQWGTYIFNHGRNEVKNFLIANALFWFDKYHIDGLRVDAVSSMLYLDYVRKPGEWLPNEFGGSENLDSISFLRELNTAAGKYYPGTSMIAEEATSWPHVTGPCEEGGLGFTFKWNMGWVNDFLRYISLAPGERQKNHRLITFSMAYNYNENFMLVLSHDEVVHGKYSMISKMPGDYLQKFSALRASYGFMFGHPGKKLLFMGNDFGQFIEWNHDQSLDWHLLGYEMHGKLQKYVKDLNFLYRNEAALHKLDYETSGFRWIDCDNSGSCVLSFIRRGRSARDILLFVCNFSSNTYYDYPVGVPFGGVYLEILNSDSELYGGSNIGNFGKADARAIPANGQPFSLRLQLPALSALVFKPGPG